MVTPTCIEDDCKNKAIWKSDKCRRHGGGPRCTEAGCTKSAPRKNDKCIAHGGGLRCIENGCNKSASGNIHKCKYHGGGVRCTEPGCTKGARNIITLKCAKHGGGKKCVEYECTNTVTEKTDKCKSHGGGLRCIEIKCEKSAIRPTNKCAKHGGGKRCKESGCKRIAQGHTDKCANHGGGLRCVEPGCNKSGKGITSKCIEHGGGPRCPNCITWIDSRSGSYRYDGYCATCFKQIFPNDKRSKVVYTHTKEIRVRNRINETFEGFIHDKPLYTGECDCTHKRRIDHRKMINSTLLCVETDEFAHSGYDLKDEEVRYDDLFMVHSGKWIFIRFNPDGKGVDMDDKLDKLIEVMNDQVERIERDENKGLIEIIKLFY